LTDLATLGSSPIYAQALAGALVDRGHDPWRPGMPPDAPASVLDHQRPNEEL